MNKQLIFGTTMVSISSVCLINPSTSALLIRICAMLFGLGWALIFFALYNTTKAVEEQNRILKGASEDKTVDQNKKAEDK